MANFRYDAKDKAGVKVSGELTAESEREAVRQLQSQGFYVLRMQRQVESITKHGMTPFAWFGRSVLEPVFLPVSPKAMSYFFSSFASSLSAGMNMHEAALGLAKRAYGSTLRKAAAEMAETAMAGKPITDVAIRYPGAFTSFTIAMLKAGEQSGTLEKAMRQMAEYFQRAHELAMLYRIETFYTKLVLAGLFIVPTLPTLILGSVEAWIRQVLMRALPFLVVLGTVWYGWRLLMRLKPLRAGVDRIKLCIPVIGTNARRYAMSKWCRAMIMLYDAGVPLSTAITVAGEATGNMAIAASLKRVAPRINDGVPVSELMEESGEFPGYIVDAMSVGERSGMISDSLEKVAETVEAESNAASKMSAMTVGVVFYLCVALVVAGYFLQTVVGYYSGMLELAEP